MASRNSTAQLFSIGDRVEFVGPEFAVGTVTSVRESDYDYHYRVAWDDGADAPEMGTDELRAATTANLLAAKTFEQMRREADEYWNGGS